MLEIDKLLISAGVESKDITIIANIIRSSKVYAQCDSF